MIIVIKVLNTYFPSLCKYNKRLFISNFRCHRIGQTRDVHIYRLISERTVEENILRKANQKRFLSDVAIEGGKFTTAFFKQNTITELFAEPSGLQVIKKLSLILMYFNLFCIRIFTMLFYLVYLLNCGNVREGFKFYLKWEIT